MLLPSGASEASPVSGTRAPCRRCPGRRCPGRRWPVAGSPASAPSGSAAVLSPREEVQEEGTRHVPCVTRRYSNAPGVTWRYAGSCGVTLAVVCGEPGAASSRVCASPASAGGCCGSRSRAACVADSPAGGVTCDVTCPRATGSAWPGDAPRPRRRLDSGAGRIEPGSGLPSRIRSRSHALSQRLPSACTPRARATRSSSVTASALARSSSKRAAARRMRLASAVR